MSLIETFVYVTGISGGLKKNISIPDVFARRSAHEPHFRNRKQMVTCRKVLCAPRKYDARAADVSATPFQSVIGLPHYTCFDDFQR